MKRWPKVSRPGCDSENRSPVPPRGRTASAASAPVARTAPRRPPSACASGDRQRLQALLQQARQQRSWSGCRFAGPRNSRYSVAPGVALASAVTRARPRSSRRTPRRRGSAPRGIERAVSGGPRRLTADRAVVPAEPHPREPSWSGVRLELAHYPARLREQRAQSLRQGLLERAQRFRRQLLGTELDQQITPRDARGRHAHAVDAPLETPQQREAESLAAS